MSSPSPMRGRMLMISSAFMLALMGMTAKSVPAPVTSTEKVFVRSVVGALILAAILFLNRRRMGRPVNWAGLSFRGTVGALALLCFFYAIDHVGLSKATLYYFTYPIWAAIMSCLDSAERPGRALVCWLGAGMAGVVVTLLPSGGGAGELGLSLTRGDIVGLVGGFFSGSAATSVRRLHRTDNSAWIVFAFTFFSTVISAPLVVSSIGVPSSLAMALMVLTGVLAIGSQWLMTAGFSHIRTVEGSLYGLAVVPFSTILGIALLGEQLRWQFWAGAALILCSTIGATIHGASCRMAKKQVAPQAVPEIGQMAKI